MTDYNYFPEDEFYEEGPSFASDRYESQVEEILAIMGKPEVSVDDSSQFWDYYSVVNDSDFQDVKDTINKLYNIEIKLEDGVWEIAEEIHKKQMG